jgi:putative membrane protein
MNSPQEYLANERTFLAWLRTCIAIIGLGFVVARFGLFMREFGITLKSGALTDVSTHYASSSLGVALVLVGIGFAIYALKNYLHANQAIKNGTYTPENSIIYSAVLGLLIFGFDFSASLRMYKVYLLLARLIPPLFSSWSITCDIRFNF